MRLTLSPRKHQGALPLSALTLLYKKKKKQQRTHTHTTLLKLKTRGDCCDSKSIVKTNTLNPSPECFFFVLSDGANGPGLAPLSKGKVLLLWGIRFILYSICKCEVVHSPDFGGS